MGIPIGKLALYTACAGVPPDLTLPVTLDVGTNNTSLQEDPLYLGLRHARVRDAEYDAFVDEFVSAVQELYPKCCIQWEDFANFNAYAILDRYRDTICTYNDDIQGTAAVALAGLYGAIRISGSKLSEQKVLFLGGGAAATGIAELISEAMALEGLTIEQARGQNWLYDIHGLVTRDRTDLTRFPEALRARPCAGGELRRCDRGDQADRDHRREHGAQALQPGRDRGDEPRQPAADHLPVLEPDLAFRMHGAGGLHLVQGPGHLRQRQPLRPGELRGKTFIPGQGNNVYIFPAIGLAVLATEATRVTQEMFICAAQAVAEQVTHEQLASGLIYPPQSHILEASLHAADTGRTADLRSRPGPGAAPGRRGRARTRLSPIRPSTRTTSEGGTPLSSPQTTTLGGYLAARITQAGITDFFGVPGDYNLVLLDELLKQPGLRMVGCCNELNAGYAADGYARVRGFSAVVVTYMVGATSLLNATAGAYSDDLPVLVVSGGPNSNDAPAHHLLHHTIGEKELYQAAKCFDPVVRKTFVVRHLDDATAMIDEALLLCLRDKKPVYLEIACNLANARVSVPGPMTFPPARMPSDPASLQAAVDAALAHLQGVVKPVLIAGVKLAPAGATGSFEKLADALGCAVAVMPNAKGLLREDHPGFVGTYWGEVSSAGLRRGHRIQRLPDHRRADLQRLHHRRLDGADQPRQVNHRRPGPRHRRGHAFSPRAAG